MSWVKANRILNVHDKKKEEARLLSSSAKKSSARDGSRGSGSSSVLSMYTDPPDGDISLEEFERFAVDRLHVLRGIEDLKAQNTKGEELEKSILRLASQYIKDETKEATMRKDSAGHHILRLAHCRTDDLRRKFLNLECELFRARFKDLSAIDQKDFIRENEFPAETLSSYEYDDIRDELRATTLSITNSVAQANSLSQDSWYKVDFEKVADLVATRRVFVKQGVAYISRDQLGSLVMAPFRSHVSKELAVLSRKWASFCEGPEKDRLVPLVSGLSDRYLGPDYSSTQSHGLGEKVTAAMLPMLQKESFPLCMSLMMDSLKKSHHLKHTGRQQLGLFLKGIGLPLEEAMRFWRTEMAATAPGDAFDKQYAYNIRHNYGKEGKRADYTPHSCIKVISTIPGPGQVHGCPYRVLGEEELRASLSKLSISDPLKIDQAVSKAKAGHYQLACATMWEGMHGCSCDSGINHPNQYYDESRKQRGVVTGENDVRSDVNMVTKNQRDAESVELKTPAAKVARMSTV